ncbi:MAG TPA: type II toxin-antitoxin system VapC family toxin [Candidatus Competibacter sp.]|jgi:predicted nucleic acid-binding protein|nr:type II toxin-antitoxin system VapC family toxin [Candidatus Competibacter sp.]HRX63006.1 type II toxin-antitoxin system VapC family toxin [Candidatus Competibacter sp.]HUM91949.1 type II toxin-antitoxin system VapC family toxin [Candidatus Competibacter sp.]
MGLVLDTCILIHAERHGALDFSPWASHGDAFISAITVSELLVGVHRADSDARRARRSAFVEAILAQLPALDFTTETARVHAGLFATLSQQGQMIGAHDLIIAATALLHDCVVLTTNAAEFARVPGLDVLTPPVS